MVDYEISHRNVWFRSHIWVLNRLHVYLNHPYQNTGYLSINILMRQLAGNMEHKGSSIATDVAGTRLEGDLLIHSLVLASPHAVGSEGPCAKASLCCWQI